MFSSWATKAFGVCDTDPFGPVESVGASGSSVHGWTMIVSSPARHLDVFGHLQHVRRRILPRRRLRGAEVDQHVLLLRAVVEGEEEAVAEADVVAADLQ